MKKEIINLSDWDGFNDLYKSQIEMEGYLRILNYLLDNQIEPTNEHYQYYEKKYINSYFDLTSNKENLSTYLLSLNNNIIKWNMNFKDKEVSIFYD